jgi:hypothetical protein
LLQCNIIIYQKSKKKKKESTYQQLQNSQDGDIKL